MNRKTNEMTELNMQTVSQPKRIPMVAAAAVVMMQMAFNGGLENRDKTGTTGVL